jgi:dUTP pyrophosphatase
MNNMIEVKFVKTHPDAVLPIQNHCHALTGDSGLDVTAVENILVPAKSGCMVNVGLQLGYITPGYWIRVESRSGLQFKHNISAFNGIIDNPYRGDMGVRLINNSDIDYKIQKGDRVAQFVIYPLIAASTSFIDVATQTERGSKGFGSSGR